VIKDGRMYDANTMDEIYPAQRKLSREWQSVAPVVNTTIKP